MANNSEGHEEQKAEEFSVEELIDSFPDEDGEEAGEEQASEELEEEEEGSEDDEDEEDEDEPVRGKASSSSSSRTIAALQAQIQQLTQAVGQLTASQSATPNQQAELGEEDFLKEVGDDFQDTIATPDGLNKLLNKVYKKAVVKARELSLADASGVVAKEVNTQLTTKGTVQQFYLDNPDLKGKRKLMGSTAEELSSLHPEWSLDKLLKETAKSVRKELGLKTPKEQQSKARKPSHQAGLKPGAHQPGSRSGKKLTRQQQDIVDLLS